MGESTWKDRPDQPGLWAYVRKGDKTWSGLVDASDPAIERSFYLFDWYGPIPPLLEEEWDGEGVSSP